MTFPASIALTNIFFPVEIEVLETCSAIITLLSWLREIFSFGCHCPGWASCYILLNPKDRFRVPTNLPHCELFQNSPSFIFTFVTSIIIYDTLLNKWTNGLRNHIPIIRNKDTIPLILQGIFVNKVEKKRINLNILHLWD